MKFSTHPKTKEVKKNYFNHFNSTVKKLITTQKTPNERPSVKSISNYNLPTNYQPKLLNYGGVSENSNPFEVHPIKHQIPVIERPGTRKV